MVFFAIIFVYLFVGAVLARKDYARRVLAANGADRQLLLNYKTSEINSIRHENRCWRGASHRSTTENCDCYDRNIRNYWSRLDREIKALEAGIISTGSPYPMFLAWPALGLHHFLVGGTAKAAPTPDYALSARLERELLDLED